MKKYIMGIFLICVLLASSWVITCGLVKLICFCFALKFTLRVATGIWLILGLLKAFFNLYIKEGTSNDSNV